MGLAAAGRAIKESQAALTDVSANLTLREGTLDALGAGGRDSRRIRDLTATVGRNSIGHLAAYGADRFWWAAPDSGVPYTVRHGTAIALGDPISVETDTKSLVAGFRSEILEQGLACSFFQTQSRQPYDSLHFRLIRLGCEAIIDLDGFRLAGRDRAELRHALARAGRAGLSLMELPGARAWAAFRAELEAVSRNWLGRSGAPQMGFSLGGLDTLRDPRILVSLAVTSEGRVEAFASWLPVPATRRWTLDLMRRRHDATYGATTALIAHAALEARERNLAGLSLGLVPFHLEPEDAAAYPLRLAYGWLGGMWHSRSLHHFKAKFLPRWESRYVATTGHPIRTANAVLRAHIDVQDMRGQLRFLRAWTSGHGRPDYRAVGSEQGVRGSPVRV